MGLADHRLPEPDWPGLSDLWPDLGFSSVGAGALPAGHAGASLDTPTDTGARRHRGIPHAAARMDRRLFAAPDAVCCRRTAARRDTVAGRHGTVHPAATDLYGRCHPRTVSDSRGNPDGDRFGRHPHGAAAFACGHGRSHRLSSARHARAYGHRRQLSLTSASAGSPGARWQAQPEK
jgi:hypothetical protein